MVLILFTNPKSAHHIVIGKIWELCILSQNYLVENLLSQNCNIVKWKYQKGKLAINISVLCGRPSDFLSYAEVQNTLDCYTENSQSDTLRAICSLGLRWWWWLSNPYPEAQSETWRCAEQVMEFSLPVSNIGQTFCLFTAWNNKYRKWLQEILFFYIYIHYIRRKKKKFDLTDSNIFFYS